MKTLATDTTIFTRLLFILLFPFFVPFTFAQDVVKVEGVCVYHAPENCSIEQARQTALSRAKIQALADAFGTVVAQTNATRVNNNNGKTQVDFLSIGTSDVKGEWIETIGTPEYKVETIQNTLVVTVKVKGYARALTAQKAEMTVRLLRNGVEDKFEGDRFKSGDDLYLSFQSPTDGYLAVYLIDAQPRAYCLLPYRNQSDGIYKVKANQRYVFFNKKVAHEEERHLVDEYIMTCDAESEHNQVYVIFSSSPFSKANDNSTSRQLPRELDYDDFMRWLSKCKRLDVTLNSMVIPITLVK